MTDDEVRAEITRQLVDVLTRLSDDLIDRLGPIEGLEPPLEAMVPRFLVMQIVDAMTNVRDELRGVRPPKRRRSTAGR